MTTRSEREDRDAWLEARKQFVTASDVGAIMGLSPHKSRAKVLREKVRGDHDDIDMLPVVMAGKHLEAGIFQWHLRHRGFCGKLWAEIMEPGWSSHRSITSRVTAGLLPHPTCSALAATPDGLTWVDPLDGADVATEIKNVGLKKATDGWEKKWRRGESNNIPDNVVLHAPKYLGIDGAKLFAPVYYWAQLQAQLACLGLERGRIVVCFGGQSRADLDYHLDTAFVVSMIQAVEEFWSEVETGRELLSV